MLRAGSLVVPLLSTGEGTDGVWVGERTTQEVDHGNRH